MAKNKKPTMMEVKNAISNILVEMSHMSQTMRAIDSALASYVEFKGESKEWREWVNKKIKEREKNAKSAKKSSKRTTKTTKAKSAKGSRNNATKG